ncbi:putative nucleoprotein [Tongilchon virus 1]|uniref:Nucleoprotein n=1 Tax=Tongilchon virus 1 TaxID=1758878 RepID=A0A0S2RRE4_9RHAB|nr:putative nucleoprotein [Tongilchon virus 1]ALP32031.1 putative nucleoprotein [Tongilchon virus 1]
MADQRVIRRVSTDPDKRVQITHMEIGTEKPIAYPSEWFAVEGREKPTMMLIPTGGVTREGIHATVRAGFADGSLDARVAVRFLYDEFHLKSGTLNTDWTSFGKAIGARGGAVTIACLLSVTEDEQCPPLVQGANLMSDSEILKYVIMICSVYRIGQISREDYRTKISDNVRNLLEPLEGDDMDPQQYSADFKRWIAYQPYVKMMAAIDMFLQEFPFHVYSQARVGTIITRFKDCSALISTQAITKCLGLDFVDFAPWIWTSRCAEQFVRVTKGGEEMDNPRSYAMYFMDLGLSSKSPYSASVNPDLHFFYHVIGTCSGLQRSRNARFVGQPEVNNILLNALVVHYVMGTFATINEQFSVTGEPIQDVEEQQAEPGLPQGKDPALWLGYMMQRNGQIPVHMRRRAGQEWLQHPESRDDTIGRYLYDKGQAFIANDVA